MSDLSVEFAHKLSARVSGKIKNKINKNVAITKICVDEKSAIKLGKEVGTYFTIEFPFDPILQSLEKREVIKQTQKALKQVVDCCNINELKSVLVVGLGNPKMVADCFGEKTINKVLVTRHVTKLVHNLDNICEVSCLKTDVFGRTGLESFDIVSGVVNKIKPNLVILIDTLVANIFKRLCTNIQIANVGIIPGSGVDNARKELSQKTLGVPTITIGVPFVVYADCFCTEEAKKILKRITNSRITGNFNFKSLENLVVMPREIEQQLKFCSDVVSCAINQTLNPNITQTDIETFFN